MKKIDFVSQDQRRWLNQNEMSLSWASVDNNETNLNCNEKILKKQKWHKPVSYAHISNYS